MLSISTPILFLHILHILDLEIVAPNGLVLNQEVQFQDEASDKFTVRLLK